MSVCVSLKVILEDINQYLRHGKGAKEIDIQSGRKKTF